MVLALRHCQQIIYVKTTLYIIPALLWLVLTHVELINCSVLGTQTVVLLPCALLCIPFNISMVEIPHYNTVSFTHFTNNIMYFFVVLFGYNDILLQW